MTEEEARKEYRRLAGMDMLLEMALNAGMAVRNSEGKFQVVENIDQLKMLLYDRHMMLN